MATYKDDTYSVTKSPGFTGSNAGKMYTYAQVYIHLPEPFSSAISKICVKEGKRKRF